MAEKREGKTQPRYSGELSKKFWAKVNSFPTSENSALYQLGCALQDLEGRVLAELQRLEHKRTERRQP